MTKEARSRIGRPTTPGAEGEKSTLSVRASADLKDRLVRASGESGRSLSAEAEFRLEQSFRDERRPLFAAMDLAFGRELAGILIVAGQAMARTRDFDPFPDLKRGDAWVYDQMVKAAAIVLDAFRPAGAIEPPETPSVAAGEDARRLFAISEETARNRLFQLTLDSPGWSDPARELMGEDLVNRARAVLDRQGLGWEVLEE